MPGSTRIGLTGPEAQMALVVEIATKVGVIEGDLKEVKDGFREFKNEMKESMHAEINIIRERLHSNANTLNSLQLQWATMKGFGAGQKAAFVLIGSVLGTGIGALLTWLLGKH